MGKPIIVRYQQRYWRLTDLLEAHGVNYDAGYKRYVDNGRPKIFKKWMLVPVEATVGVPKKVWVDGVEYPSQREACKKLGVSGARLYRRMEKYGDHLTSEQLTPYHERKTGYTFKKTVVPTAPKPARTEPEQEWEPVPKRRVKSEWDMLSNKKNTGAARRNEQETYL